MEIAIGMTDLAESLGSAVALNLLFHIPLQWAIIITAFDVLLLLALQGFGMRLIEAVVTVFVLTIGVCYGIEIFGLAQTQPDFLEMGRAMVRPDFAQARDALRGHRHHRGDRHAAQPVPPYGPGADPQTAAGRAVRRPRHPVQHDRLGGGADHRVLHQRGHPGAGGDRVLRQGRA